MAGVGAVGSLGRDVAVHLAEAEPSSLDKGQPSQAALTASNR